MARHENTRFGVTPKIIGLLLVFAFVPVCIVGFTIFSTFDSVKSQSGSNFEIAAATIADKIDRNLFERYGDAKSFGLNRVIFDRILWYRDANDNPLVEIMNNYVRNYGIYYLTLLVDTEGKLIAVNNMDSSGKQIAVKDLYQKDYSNSTWFQALKKQQFTRRMPFTAPGNDISNGTFIEDLHIDHDVKTAYASSDALTLGFSAPVYQDGKVIAYWSNRTKFSLVEEIFADAYQSLKQAGYPSAELTLLDKDGYVIIDYDPKLVGSDNVQHDFSVLFKLNLATSAIPVAQKAVNGESGHDYTKHARKNIMQAAGYTHLKGALGYPGMNWSVLVRVDEGEAVPWLSVIKGIIATVSVVCLIIAAVIGVFIGGSIVQRIKKIVSVTERAAEGDLTHNIVDNSHDEFGQLASAFNEMIGKQRDMLDQVRSSTECILNSAREIARGNQDLSQRTEEQSSSLEETASSMEEMTSTVKQNADSARDANELATTASHDAELGGKVVEDAVNAMEAITYSSRKIYDIIGVIDDIAFQTNLLALNAAVEAARAGEQGRGFAVVANEVRELAQRSAESAKEIKELIGDSVDKVNMGSDLVNKSGETLKQIVTSIRKVNAIVAEIASASREQASGISQVNTAVTQMDEMTQRNAALVEQSSTASATLEDLANGLMEQVDQFTLGARSHAYNATSSNPKGTPLSGSKDNDQRGQLSSQLGQGEEWSEF